MYDLTLNAANRIPFVLVDATGTEVAGLGGAFTITLSKNGSAFGVGVGSKAELTNGWYLYIATAGECDTAGPLALQVAGVGAVQQNLVYRVVAMAAGTGALIWTYALTSAVDGSAIEAADVWVTTDIAGDIVIASGQTDASGMVRFYLDAGTYYVWRQKDGWTFVNPDSEVVA